MSDIHTAERLDPVVALDTGVAVTLRLNSPLVTVEEAAVFLTFLDRSVDAILSALSKEHGAEWEAAIGRPLEFVPVIRVSGGSIECAISLSVKNGKLIATEKEGVKDFLLDVAKQVAATVISGLIAAFLVGKPETNEGPDQLLSPPAVIQEVQGDLETEARTLATVLDKSGKTWSIEIDTPDGVRRIARGGLRPTDGDFVIRKSL